MLTAFLSVEIVGENSATRRDTMKTRRLLLQNELAIFLFWKSISTHLLTIFIMCAELYFQAPVAVNKTENTS